MTHPLAQWRATENLTQVRAAARLGISPGYLAQLEQAQCLPSTRMILRLAAATGIPTGAFVVEIHPRPSARRGSRKMNRLQAAIRRNPHNRSPAKGARSHRHGAVQESGT